MAFITPATWGIRGSLRPFCALNSAGENLQLHDGGEMGNSEKLGQGWAHSPCIVVDGLFTAEDHVIVPTLDECGQGLGSGITIGLLQGGILNLKRLIGTHGDTPPQGIGRLFGSQGYNRHYSPALFLLDAQGLLHREFIEEVEGVLVFDIQFGVRLSPDDGLRIGHLFYQNQDIHVISPP